MTRLHLVLSLVMIMLFWTSAPALADGSLTRPHDGG
jgi:hypothetical protein